MALHELKVCSTVFPLVDVGIKTFEFRKNDRDYKVWDSLYLRNWDSTKGEYVGGGKGLNACVKRVTYIIYGPNFGIPEGYCIMSIK